jgi:hypothetical protein
MGREFLSRGLSIGLVTGRRRRIGRGDGGG